MNHDQERAASQLLRAFNLCRDAGLSGGIYDGQVCVWPKAFDPHESDDFFGEVDRVGRSFTVDRMNLDGGAGT